MEICPLAKSGEELILNLINSENNTEITAEQLVLGTPAANSEGGNTALNVAAAEDAPWNKFVDVSYDRLDMATIFHNERAEISLPKGATPSDLVCHLNYTYGTAFKVDEFDIIPLEDGELPELYEMKAKAENLAYTGTLQVFADLDRMPLSARLTVTDLNGFGYYSESIPSLNNVIEEYPVTMPANYPVAIGRGTDGRTNYTFARNGEVVVGYRAIRHSNFTTESAAGVTRAADGKFNIITDTPAGSPPGGGNTWRGRPWRFCMFLGLDPAQTNFAHIADGYDMEIELTTSSDGAPFVVKGNLVRSGNDLVWQNSVANILLAYNSSQKMFVFQLDDLIDNSTTIVIRRLLNGLRMTERKVYGPGIIYNGIWIRNGAFTAKLKLVRKTGRAKPVEVVMSANVLP